MQISTRGFLAKLAKSISRTIKLLFTPNGLLGHCLTFIHFFCPAGTMQYEFPKFCHAGVILAWLYHKHAALTAESH